MSLLRAQLLIASLLILLPTAGWAEDVPDQSEAKVVKVESGEVLVVQLAESKKRVKVRVLGVECGAKARSTAAQLVGGSSVVLRSDKGFLPILEDQFGRYVAYVQTQDGRDLGLEMLKAGACSSEDWKLAHPRVTEYASASR